MKNFLITFASIALLVTFVIHDIGYFMYNYGLGVEQDDGTAALSLVYALVSAYVMFILTKYLE